MILLQDKFCMKSAYFEIKSTNVGNYQLQMSRKHPMFFPLFYSLAI